MATNVSIYDERDMQLWARVYRDDSGVVNVCRGGPSIQIRSEEAACAFLCGIEHSLEIDAFIVVVHTGAEVDEYVIERFGETIVTTEHVDPGSQYPGLGSGEAAHLCVERIARYAWRLLN